MILYPPSPPPPPPPPPPTHTHTHTHTQANCVFGMEYTVSMSMSVCMSNYLSITFWFYAYLANLSEGSHNMILCWSSFKVVQMVPVHCISRSQELKIDFLTKNLKNLLVRNHWTDFNIILQKCSFGDPLPRLFKPFGFVKKHGGQGAGHIFPMYLYRKL